MFLYTWSIVVGTVPDAWRAWWDFSGYSLRGTAFILLMAAHSFCISSVNIQRILKGYRHLDCVRLDGPSLNGRKIWVQGPANSYTGYGLHTSAVVHSLSALGYQVQLQPLGPVETTLPATIVETCQQPVLAIQPLSSPPSAPVDYWFTMHESTRMPEAWLAHLNQASQVIVPSTWNAVCFSAQGCPRPIHVCPLGVDTDCFCPGEPDAVCTFGAAGSPVLSSEARKNMSMAVRAFGLAFPHETDVRLKVKLLPGTELSAVDSRIDIQAACWTETQMADWMRSLSAFVLPSRAEAWSFFSLQALACACPVIAVPFGGLTDYFSAEVGYPVDFKLVPVPDGLYQAVGLWAEPSLVSMVAQMRYVYENRDDARRRGRKGRERAESYTWSAVNVKLEQVLAQAFVKPQAVGPRSDRDIIIDFYRKARKVPKKRLPDFTQHTLINTPAGLGDTVLLTSIPWLAHRQGKERFIHHDSPSFEALMAFNPHYQPMRPDAPTIAADVLQSDYDMGAGHFIQRLQRAVGLYPERKPKGFLNIEHRPVKNRFVFHFEPGRHAQWQAQFVHPKARQIYPDTREILQRYVNAHRDFEFFEVGRAAATLENVELLNLPLDETIKFLATCDYFVGIISGPMHLATALGVRCVVIVNFPEAERIVLPTLVDIDQVESEWFYPQNVLLHQDGEGPQVKRFSQASLERALGGDVYPYWTDSYLNLDSYTHIL